MEAGVRLVILLLKKELCSYTKLPTPITEKAACERTSSLRRQLNLFQYVIMPVPLWHQSQQLPHPSYIPA